MLISSEDCRPPSNGTNRTMLNVSSLPGFQLSSLPKQIHRRVDTTVLESIMTSCQANETLDQRLDTACVSLSSTLNRITRLDQLLRAAHSTKVLFTPSQDSPVDPRGLACSCCGSSDVWPSREGSMWAAIGRLRGTRRYACRNCGSNFLHNGIIR